MNNSDTETSPAKTLDTQPFTIQECEQQARRLLELAIKEEGDRELKYAYVKLKLAFQNLAEQLLIRQEETHEL